MTGFSNASRSRLLRMVNGLNRWRCASLPLFVTLTYPDEYQCFEDGLQWKQDLEHWIKRFRRKHGDVAIIWKMELQTRKSGWRKGAWLPHFHILIFADLQPIQLYEEVSSTWWEVCGRLSDAHRAAGTQVQQARSWREAISYLAKYMGKPEQFVGTPAETMGRFWGVSGRKNLPTWSVTFVLGVDDLIRVRRVLRKYAGMRFRTQRLLFATHTYISDVAALRLLEYYGGDPRAQLLQRLRACLSP